MSNDNAVEFKGVSQKYILYPSPGEMAFDTLGINKILARKPNYKEFLALSNINLEIKKGERVGIIGRNGAGKTTLLKLITCNYKPSEGEVQVNGKVQTLMDAGLGFHPEFTGIENIKSSLLYNGLSARETKIAVDDIVDFVELGEFLHQPIRTYSLGMATRLAFAVATAIKPDILIVDEVLGAGDAYFAAKSSERMKKLTSGGATLLLVSHSNQQILQYCERAIWLDHGKIKESGDSLEVVKMYEAYIRNIEDKRIKSKNESSLEKSKTVVEESATKAEGPTPINRKVSRWEGNQLLMIESLRILDSSSKERYVFQSGEEFCIEFSFRALKEGHFKARYHLYIFGLNGVNVSLHLSDEDTFDLREGEIRTIKLKYDKIFLGNGEYVVTAGLYKHIDMDHPENFEMYDLIDRSFHFKVDSRYKTDKSIIHHPAHWVLEDGSVIKDHSEVSCISTP